MSSLKTERYQLHKWEAGDDFLRSEFNENFEAIDGAVSGKADGASTAAALASKAEVVLGAYVGDSAIERTIDLGFHPQAVLVIRSDGAMTDGSSMSGGFAMRGRPSAMGNDVAVEVVSNGFHLTRGGLYNSRYFIDPNQGGQTYYYVAMK